MNLRDVYFVIVNQFVMTIVKFISDDFHRRATSSTYDLKSDLSVSKSLNIESSSFIDYNVTDITRTSSLGTICVLDILYNYYPCWSVTRRFVSQRKVRSPKGLPEVDLTFRGETNRRITRQQG
jgi:hypothetical protein